jgi:hypothetical protein
MLIRKTLSSFLSSGPISTRRSCLNSAGYHTQLFVKGLPATITEENLFETFKRYGDVNKVYVFRPKNTQAAATVPAHIARSMRTNAFVEMRLMTSALAAHDELDGTILALPGSSTGAGWRIEIEFSNIDTRGKSSNRDPKKKFVYGQSTRSKPVGPQKSTTGQGSSEGTEKQSS